MVGRVVHFNTKQEWGLIHVPQHKELFQFNWKAVSNYLPSMFASHPKVAFDVAYVGGKPMVTYVTLLKIKEVKLNADCT